MKSEISKIQCGFRRLIFLRKQNCETVINLINLDDEFRCNCKDFKTLSVAKHFKEKCILKTHNLINMKAICKCNKYFLVQKNIFFSIFEITVNHGVAFQELVIFQWAKKYFALKINFKMDL